MNTSTATEQIPDSNSRFSLLAIDDRNVRDNRSQREKKKLAKSSVAETSIGKNASVDFQEIYHDLLDGEKSESAEDLKISPPEICTNSSQMRNDSEVIQSACANGIRCIKTCIILVEICDNILF